MEIQSGDVVTLRRRTGELPDIGDEVRDEKLCLVRFVGREELIQRSMVIIHLFGLVTRFGDAVSVEEKPLAFLNCDALALKREIHI